MSGFSGVVSGSPRVLLAGTPFLLSRRMGLVGMAADVWLVPLGLSLAWGFC